MKSFIMKKDVDNDMKVARGARFGRGREEELPRERRFLSVAVTRWGGMGILAF